MAEISTTSTSARWFFGICAAFAVFAVVGVYSSRMAYNTGSYDDGQAQERYAKLAKLQAADGKTLTTAGWVDQDKGVARIPIDEAMTEEVDVLKAKPVKMGDAIPGAAPTTMNTIPATNTPPANGAPPAPTAAGTTPGQAAPAADTAKAPETNASPVAPTPPAPPNSN